MAQTIFDAAPKATRSTKVYNSLIQAQGGDSKKAEGILQELYFSFTVEGKDSTKPVLVTVWKSHDAVESGWDIHSQTNGRLDKEWIVGCEAKFKDIRSCHLYSVARLWHGVELKIELSTNTKSLVNGNILHNIIINCRPPLSFTP